MNINDIKLNPKNPRLIKNDKFKKLVKSIKDFPTMMELRPIVVNKDGVILGGNMRYKAIKELGMKDIPDQWVKTADKLTDEEEKRFIIEDNISFGDWDFEMLNSDWEKDFLIESGLDDFNIKKPKKLSKKINDDIKTDIKYGDMFKIGNHKILCGDSTKEEDVLKLFGNEKPNTVISSPPYNSNTGINDKTLYLEYNDNLSSKDYLKFIDNVLSLCFKHTNGFIFWNVNYNNNSKSEFIKQIYNYIDKLVETICWKKSNAIPHTVGIVRIWEPIFVFKVDEKNNDFISSHKSSLNFFEISNVNISFESHKATYPIELVTELIELYKDCKIIYDPFIGTGTTLIAAEQLNKICYGIDISPTSIQIILDRIKEYDNTIKIEKLN